jgi:outer membrane protein
MHTVSRFTMLFLLFCLVALPVRADELLSLKVGYLLLEPQGDFAAEVDGVGTLIDVEDDLNFDDSKGVTAEVGLQLGSFRLSAGYLPLSFSGDASLNRDVVFDGQTFTANTQVSSDIDVDLYDIGLTWYLLNTDEMPVRVQLGPELAVKVADAEVSMTDRTIGITEEASGVAPIPTVGLRGRVAFGDMFGIVGRVGYISYSDNSFLDAEVQVEFSPVPMVGIYAGYRLFDIDIDENDVLLDLRFSGPFAGVMVRF